MENFIVSARKFRPQTFRSVVGQQHITRTLKNAIERGKLAHAYLFTGPRGVGKTSCARIFARTINCLNPTAEYEACGTCESCVSFAKDRSFNIHELDAASNNSVDDIRALTEKVRIAPQVGKYSVYIIDEVHMLSTAAFNAFLKTLEEPPHYAIFILATTEKHKILPTILSRCQVYDFSRIRVEDIVDYLKYIASEQGVSYDEESLHIIAQKADGGMRDALSTFDRVVSFCGVNLSASQVAESIGALDFATYFRATELALGESFTELLLLLDSTIQRGFDAQIFLAGLSEHLRNLLVAKNPQTLSLLEASEGLSVQYQRQAAEADYDFLFNAINLLNQADTTYKASTNRRLHSELALIKLCALKKKEPIAERYPMPQIVVEARATERTEATEATGSNPISPDLSVLNVPPVPIAIPPAAPPAAPAAAPAAAPPAAPAAAPPAAPIAAPIAVPSATTPAPPTPQKRSITGLSLSPAAVRQEQSEKPARETVSEFLPQESEALIRQCYPDLIKLWQNRSRPRIASALEICRIEGDSITIAVPDEVQQSELHQAKAEIERDIFELTGGVRPCLMVIIRFVEQKYRPVTLEQKYQHLAELNPNLVKLHKMLDLTI